MVRINCEAHLLTQNSKQTSRVAQYFDIYLNPLLLCCLLSFSWIRWCHRVFVSFVQIFHFDAHLVSLNFIFVEILNDDSSFFRIINMIIENWNQCHEMYQPYKWFLINFSFCCFLATPQNILVFSHTNVANWNKRAQLKAR